MVKTNARASQLHKIEIDLNKIHFYDIEIGASLSFYFDRLYRGDFDNRFFRHLILLVYFFVKSIFQKKNLKEYNKEIIYFKTGSHYHLKAIENAVLHDKATKQKTIIIGPSGSSCLSKDKVFYNFRFIDFFKVSLFFFLNFRKISELIKPLDINLKTRSTLYINLIIQLLKVQSLKKFYRNQNSLKLIGSDYDRGVDTCLIFSVAKGLNIKNFTLQHGVINPPVGYSPVNANEVWVWSEMAQLQLMELGVNKYKIRITGTPIVSELNISNELGLEKLDKYGLKKGNTVVLALSAPNKANDLKMVEFLAQVKEQYGALNDNYLVKIHPARDYSNYSWIQEDYGLQILPQSISLEDFMNITDVLLAHTSGLATEALYYGKKVGILDILDESPGNGLELNKYLGVPLLKTPMQFKLLLDSKVNKINSNMLYFKTGVNAKVEISECIKILLD